MTDTELLGELRRCRSILRERDREIANLKRQLRPDLTPKELERTLSQVLEAQQREQSR